MVKKKKTLVELAAEELGVALPPAEAGMDYSRGVFVYTERKIPGGDPSGKLPAEMAIFTYVPPFLSDEGTPLAASERIDETMKALLNTYGNSLFEHITKALAYKESGNDPKLADAWKIPLVELSGKFALGNLGVRGGAGKEGVLAAYTRFDFDLACKSRESVAHVLAGLASIAADHVRTLGKELRMYESLADGEGTNLLLGNFGRGNYGRL